jgi:hypothetical protein
MYSPLGFKEAANIDRIFEEIDTEKNGVISKEEFKAALERMNYYDLLKVHKSVHANLEKKIAVVEKIEKGMVELEAAYEEKQKAYSNVGMMTGAEIDALFDKSKMKKKEVKVSVGELRGLIAQAKDMFHIGKKD